MSRTPSATRPTKAQAIDLELWGRRALLVLVAAAALTGVLAGLARTGVVIAWGGAHAFGHGPLMVLGVFGTLIALERAVALGRGWGYLAPVLGAAASVAMLAGHGSALWLAPAMSLALAAVNVAIVRRQAASFTWLMLLGSVLLVWGSVAWMYGRPVFEVVPAWLSFFVLTITSERLELSRLAPTPRWAHHVLVVLSLVLALCACVCALGGTVLLRQLHGLSMALLGVWQLRFDLARRTVRQRGLPRFAALGVLLGAAWLLLTGVLFTLGVFPPAGPLYDAGLHGVLVGYVLSMVFAHAPIIFPAVARLKMPFSPLLYVPLSILHLGLVARVLGDIWGVFALRKYGAIANALALAAFVLAVVFARLTARPVRRT